MCSAVKGLGLALKLELFRWDLFTCLSSIKGSNHTQLLYFRAYVFSYTFKRTRAFKNDM